MGEKSVKETGVGTDFFRDITVESSFRILCFIVVYVTTFRIYYHLSRLVDKHCFLAYSLVLGLLPHIAFLQSSISRSLDGAISRIPFHPLGFYLLYSLFSVLTLPPFLLEDTIVTFISTLTQ